MHNLQPNYNSTNETIGNERGGEKTTGMRLEGMIWKGEGAVHQEDWTKFFFLMKGKESCVRRGRERGGEGGWCLTFFKGIINSLSSLGFLIISAAAIVLVFQMSLPDFTNCFKEG